MPREKLIQLRAGTAALWDSVNPILEVAEKGHETDTRKSKTGDGVTAWNSLLYDVGESATSTFQEVTTAGNTTNTDVEIAGELTLGNGSTGFITFEDSNGGEIEVSGEFNINHDVSINLTSPVVTKNGNPISSFNGVYNATTNTPALSNANSNRNAVYYEVTVAGTQDFGGGNIVLAIGDRIENNGTIWFKSVDNNQSGGSTTLPWLNIQDAPYNGVADALGDSGVDSTPAWNAALDDLETAGGGILYIPYVDGKRFNITPGELVTRDYSNIAIVSFTKGNIFIKETQGVVTNSRGILVNIGSGTDNFSVKKLDVLVSSGAFRNNFENGIICSQSGNWSNITIEDNKFENESKLDTEIGVDAITLFRNVGVVDTDTGENLIIRNNNIKLYGNSIYGIQILRKTFRTNVYGNTIELTAFSDMNNDSFNAIAMYGDSQYFNIEFNTVVSSGHSGIASSMSSNGSIKNNFVFNVTNPSEAGIEIEYKATHGTESVASHGVDVYKNYIQDCYYGIWVTERDDSPTTFAPYDLNIENNEIRNSTINDIFVASKLTGSSDTTSIITNVTINNNDCFSTATDAGIRIYDSKDTKVINNTCVGQVFGIKIGRNTNILPTGYLLLQNNEVRDNTNKGILVEQMNCDLTLDNNRIINPTNQCFQVAAAVGGHISLTDNFSDGGVTGFLCITSSLEEMKVTGNRAINASGRGFQITSVNGSAAFNTSNNCPTPDLFSGAGMVTTDNKDL